MSVGLPVSNTQYAKIRRFSHLGLVSAFFHMPFFPSVSHPLRHCCVIRGSACGRVKGLSDACAGLVLIAKGSARLSETNSVRIRWPGLLWAFNLIQPAALRLAGQMYATLPFSGSRLMRVQPGRGLRPFVFPSALILAFRSAVASRAFMVFSLHFPILCPILRLLASVKNRRYFISLQPDSGRVATCGPVCAKNPPAGNGTSLLGIKPAGGNEVQSNSQTEGTHA